MRLFFLKHSFHFQYLNCFRTSPVHDCFLSSGPAIDYGAECLKWWDCHLKGIQNNAMSIPRLRLYLQEGLPPQGSYQTRPGHWVTETIWPPPMIENNRYLTLALDNSTMSLVKCALNDKIALSDCTKVVEYDGRAGLAGMKWYTYGAADELPDDQKPAEKYGLCWHSDVLEEDIAILGQPTLHCNVSVENSDTGVLIARICDVSPDGRSTLLSYGILNLNHYQGHGCEEVTALVPKKEYKVKVKFMATSCIVKKGHKLSLGVSSSHWPLIWPSKDPVQLKIQTGSDDGDSCTKLVLPVRPSDLPSEKVAFKDVPKYPSPIETITNGSYTKKTIEAKGKDDKNIFHIDEDLGTFLVKPTIVTISGKHTIDRYEISNYDPLSARGLVKNTLALDWPEGDGSGQPVKTKISTSSEMWADKEKFYTKHNAEVQLNDTVIFQRSWDDSFPRHFC